jgi:hypothetical protein
MALCGSPVTKRRDGGASLDLEQGEATDLGSGVTGFARTTFSGQRVSNQPSFWVCTGRIRAGLIVSITHSMPGPSMWPEAWNGPCSAPARPLTFLSPKRSNQCSSRSWSNRCSSSYASEAE